MRHGAPNCPLCGIERRIGSARQIKRVYISVGNWLNLSRRKREDLVLACVAHGVVLGIEALLASLPGEIYAAHGPRVRPTEQTQGAKS